jgi:hypothetical protein
MTRKYYAATLTLPRIDGDDRAIDEVYSFSHYSMRLEWLREASWYNEERTSLKAKIAKKHKSIEVTFGLHTYADSSKGWVWFYNGFPETGE